eukprot:CAMPEP_0180321458 /NCGR_PEP_ID=MMETSP0988-20121125/36151_1 /TAXON_ID=697907 /ORGANISM="non described non described, Strain CCMP2293" /LENGTH=90 /DNA_ID=CAMNT_0022307321 /DNA_START=1 /DNA_END=273 /DNA_ORIENTATION=+
MGEMTAESVGDGGGDSQDDGAHAEAEEVDAGEITSGDAIERDAAAGIDVQQLLFNDAGKGTATRGTRRHAYRREDGTWVKPEPRASTQRL